MLLGLMFLSGVGHSMSMPASMAIVPGVVQREDVTPAIAFDSVVFQCTAFIGPMIAGVIITMLGVG
jgi:MFS family permease